MFHVWIHICSWCLMSALWAFHVFYHSNGLTCQRRFLLSFLNVILPLKESLFSGKSGPSKKEWPSKNLTSTTSEVQLHHVSFLCKKLRVTKKKSNTHLGAIGALGARWFEGHKGEDTKRIEIHDLEAHRERPLEPMGKHKQFSPKGKFGHQKKTWGVWGEKRPGGDFPGMFCRFVVPWCG